VRKKVNPTKNQIGSKIFSLKLHFDERFEHLGHTDLLRLYLYGVPDASTALSVAIFNAVDEFLKCCDRFQ